MTGVEILATKDKRRGPPPERRFRLSPLAWLAIPVVCVVPILAHGCHTGDHDDEPLFAPLTYDTEPPR